MSEIEAIIDAHCHVASMQFIPTQFVEGVCRNVMSRLAANGIRKTLKQLVDAQFAENQDDFADELVAQMQAGSVSHTILLLPDFTFALKSELTIDEMYRRHALILQRHPGYFSVFAGVDPRWGRAALELFEEGVTRYGFKGLKLYPPCGYGADDPRLGPFYEICHTYRLPVLVHIGPTSPCLSFAFSSPWQVDQPARDFPGVNFILAHGAIHSVDDCVALCAYRPNVFLDVSAFSSSLHPNGWRLALAELFRRNINHKILFGTDWPVVKSLGGHKALLAEFLSANGPLAAVSDRQRTWIMGDNARSLLQEAAVKQSAAGLPVV